MPPTPREVAESYWRAECSRDLAAIMGHFHPDAEFRPAGAILRGHDEIRTFYIDSIARFPALECRIVHEVANANEASLEWDAVLTGLDGTRNPLVGVNIVEVDDGRDQVVVLQRFEPLIRRFSRDHGKAVHLEELDERPPHRHIVFDNEHETGVLGHQYGAV